MELLNSQVLQSVLECGCNMLKSDTGLEVGSPKASHLMTGKRAFSLDAHSRAIGPVSNGQHAVV